MGIKIEKQFLLILKNKGNSDAFTNTNFIVFIVKSLNAERYNISPIPSFVYPPLEPTFPIVSRVFRCRPVLHFHVIFTGGHGQPFVTFGNLVPSRDGGRWWEDRIIKLDDETLTRCQKIGRLIIVSNPPRQRKSYNSLHY
jgi:hypothetical protein